MTDGISKDSVVGPSRDLRNAGVRILALGLGKRFRRTQLIQMTNKRKYVFSADFRNLKSVVRSISRLVCGGKLWCSLLSGIVALQATFGANLGLESDKFLFVALVAISKHLLVFSCGNFHLPRFHSFVFVKK